MYIVAYTTITRYTLYIHVALSYSIYMYYSSLYYLYRYMWVNSSYKESRNGDAHLWLMLPKLSPSPTYTKYRVFTITM